MKFEKDSEVRLLGSAIQASAIQASAIQVSTIILAGGSGTRMGGIPKSHLIMGEETFLNRNIRIAEKICSEIIISVAGEQMLDSLDYNTVRDIPVIVVFDEFEGHGPLMGILSALKESRFEVNFITTVDSPFVSIPFVEYLVQGLGDNDAHVPLWNGYSEPLFAVYRKSCIPFIQESILKNKRKITSFYDMISVKYADSEVVKGYDSEGSSFTNINTQEEYRKLLESQDR